MTTFVELPDFQTDDIVSASRLNAVARNVDVAVGLDEAKVWPVEAGADVLNCGIYSRASDARFGGNQAIYYMAHNGDRLQFYHVLFGVGGPANLYYNNQSWSNLADSAVHNLTLTSLPRYKIVTVRIEPVAQANNLYVRRLFGYDSNAQAIGTMPAFTNGGTSAAADLNTVMAGTKRAVTQLNQPVAGMYSINLNGSNGQLTTDRNGYYGYIRHKHNQLYFELSAWVDALTPGDEMTLTYNGETVWRWDPYASGNYSGGGVYLRDLTPYGFTVGDWYPVEFRMTFAANVRQRASIWALYERDPSPGSAIAKITRWAHGDTIQGDADGPPQLDEMTDALGSIAVPMRWTNPACRAGRQWIPNQSGVCNASSPIVDEFASVRVHRWLAYEPIEMADGTRAPVTLLYKTGGGYTFTSAGSLPSVTTPSYYDLDNTPIRPGMYFRLVGSKFLIQTPGYEGE